MNMIETAETESLLREAADILYRDAGLYGQIGAKMRADERYDLVYRLKAHHKKLLKQRLLAEAEAEDKP